MVFTSEVSSLAELRCQGSLTLRLVEAGESEYSRVLKTRKLLIFRDAQNAVASEIAPNWNVSGTRVFSAAASFAESF